MEKRCAATFSAWKILSGTKVTFKLTEFKPSRACVPLGLGISQIPPFQCCHCCYATGSCTCEPRSADLCDYCSVVSGWPALKEHISTQVSVPSDQLCHIAQVEKLVEVPTERVVIKEIPVPIQVEVQVRCNSVVTFHLLSPRADSTHSSRVGVPHATAAAAVYLAALS